MLTIAESTAGHERCDGPQHSSGTDTAGEGTDHPHTPSGESIDRCSRLKIA